MHVLIVPLLAFLHMYVCLYVCNQSINQKKKKIVPWKVFFQTNFPRELCPLGHFKFLSHSLFLCIYLYTWCKSDKDLLRPSCVVIVGNGMDMMLCKKKLYEHLCPPNFTEAEKKVFHRSCTSAVGERTSIYCHKLAAFSFLCWNKPVLLF